MAQRGRPKKIFTEEKNILSDEKNNLSDEKIFLTEEKNLKIDNSPRVNTADVEIEIRKTFPYSPNGYDIVTLQPGRYKASELDPVVIDLHKRGIV